MPRLGILGTMVWDSIYPQAAQRSVPVEAWGGIAYSLAAAAAALGPDWTLFPILKVGSDMRASVDEFLADLPGIGSVDGVRSVPEPNNRVELFYHDTSRRCEKLTGGVPGWRADELLPYARSCDALYVNFIAGWELDLEVATGLREAVEGPIYADIHSLMLGLGADGHRTLRPLEDWERWLDAFDVVQLNEDELRALAAGRRHPWELPAEVLAGRTRAVLVTRGARGARWAADAGLVGEESADRLYGRRGPAIPSSRDPASGGAPVRGDIETDVVIETGDPTGCGDVWGATCFTTWVAGGDLEVALRAATRAASVNAAHSGADGLARALRTASPADSGAVPEPGRGVRVTDRRP